MSDSGSFGSNRVHVLLLGLASVSASGCQDVNGSRGSVSSAETLDCPKDVTYEKVARPFFDEYCGNCHSEAVREEPEDGEEQEEDGEQQDGDVLDVPHIFDTERNIRELGAHIYEAIEDETMPPLESDMELPRPSFKDRRGILEWLECSGAFEAEPEEEHEH